MGLDNSTIQHPLPGDLQARVENALNLVTSMEAEHARLEKMIGSQKAEINDNHVGIKETEKIIAKLHKDHEHINGEVEKATDKLNQLQYAIKSANHELEESARQKTETINWIAQQKELLAERENIVLEQESELAKRKQQQTVKEGEHQKKVDRLLEALK